VGQPLAARVSRRTKTIVLVVGLVLLINLPIVHSTWTNWRVSASGTDVTVPLAEHDVLTPEDDPHHMLGFRFPEEIDPDRVLWTAEVEPDAYDEAVESGRVEVRVLEDNPAAYQVEGEVRSWFGLVTTLAADAVLLLVVVLMWRYGRRSRPAPLRLAAISDLERCPPGGVIEQVEGSLYLVRGEVVEMGEREVVLDAGLREVVVVLDGHANPVGYQQPAQVRGRALD
jgi:hypothetical protein